MFQDPPMDNLMLPHAGIFSLKLKSFVKLLK